jgi:phosphopantothenoylcysteine decarboxylase/phosphopantothenate--cysteine ligase
VKKLKKYGYHFVDPEYGEMACGGMGLGRLACIESIIGKLEAIFNPARLKRETAGKPLKCR